MHGSTNIKTIVTVLIIQFIICTTVKILNSACKMSILCTLDDVHITDSPKPLSLRLRQATIKEEIKYLGQF
jgi:hypothetical protein